MKAARFYNSKDVRIDEVEPETVGATDVRIEIEACGICGSDLHEYAIGPHFTPAESHLITGAKLPVTMGHEFSGTVSEVGANVTSVREGDPVAVNPNIPCEDCRYCEDGMYNVCPNTIAIGFQTGEGGFAENAVVPAQQVHPLPEGVTLTEAALVEPLAVGLHAVRQSGMRAGDTIAVFGCGPIGLTAVDAANRAGAKHVIASEPQDTRREIALELGADEALNPIETDPVQSITSKTADGVDVAFDFAGMDATFNAAVGSTRRGGTVTLGGLSEGTTEASLNDVVNTERRIVGTNCYGFPPRSSRTEFDAVLRSLAVGEIDTDAFVTGHIDLDDIVKSGFEALRGGEGGHAKILVTP